MYISGIQLINFISSELSTLRVVFLSFSHTCRMKGDAVTHTYSFFPRERKMCTNFFCTNFSNTPRGPGHPGKIPGTFQIPLFETQGRQTFEGGHELFGHHPFAWKTPTPPGGLRTPKVNLCALFSCLIPRRRSEKRPFPQEGPFFEERLL